MKQILSLALALLPCLAWAQYPSNGNQKITLGEQTSADGLVFRGYATTDTVAATSKITRTNKQDTSVYLLLDTVTNLLWHYKIGSNGWSQAGGSTFDTTTLNLTTRFATKLNISDTASMLTPYIERGDTASMLTPYWRAGRFSGTLPVANGGTNASTFTAGSVVFAGASGTYTQDNSGLFWDNTSKELGIGTNNPISKLDISLSSTRKFLVNFDDAIITMKGAAANGNPESIKFVGDGIRFHSGSSGSGTEIMRINSSNRVGIMTNDPTEVLHVVGNARITGAYDVTTGSAANVFVTSDGVLQRSTSSIKYKSDVEDYTKGLNEVMKLRPVTYKSINTNNDKIYAGFIAEELADLKLTELYENNYNGEPDAISYAYMVTLLTKAIQEQQEQITLLKKRLLILENK
jgi:hypothetical protein